MYFQLPRLVFGLRREANDFSSPDEAALPVNDNL
jgi:hypothetical protein